MDDHGRAMEVVRSAAGDLVGEETGARCKSEVRQKVRVLAVEDRTLPLFFVIGPPRTGSSWLHEVLSPYTWLPSPSKETRFFDTHFHRGLKWYRAHYGEPNGERRMGEVAPTYFISTPARERMAQLVPEAKIVCVFRNPIDRIVSLYRLKRAYGLLPWDFEEAIERDPELMASSRYASTLRLWQRSFGAGKVMAAVYEDLRDNPQAFLDALTDFIGVERIRLQEWQKGSVHDSERMTHPRSYLRARSATLMADWLKARRLDGIVHSFKQSRLRRLVLGGGAPIGQPSTEVLRRLHAKLEEEVVELESMLQRDLSAWKTPRAA